MTLLQELEQFTRFAQAHLGQKQEELSLEECLRLWRRQNEADELAADIQASMADYAAGRVVDAQDAFDEARRQLGLAR